MSKAKKQRNTSKHRALSAQQTIPYIAMHPDGICQLPGGLYTKTLEYEDINYAVASTEDQTAIISGWSACLNYFDSSLPFQLSFVNRRSRNANRYKVNIPAQEDDFNSIRGEYVEMLKGQIAKSNNGIERYKYITFGLPAEGVAEARPRLGRVEADVMGNLKRLGVQSRPLDGRDRLAVSRSALRGKTFQRLAWGQRTISPRTASISGRAGLSVSARCGARRPICRSWRRSFRISCWRRFWSWTPS